MLRVLSVISVLAWFLSLAPACSSGGAGSCLDPLYACLGAEGDCLAETVSQRTTVTWDSGARLEGPIGLMSFEAFSAGGQRCFLRRLEAGVILLEADGGLVRVERGPDGSLTVTCQDGGVERHPAGSLAAGQPGIDPGRLTGCRLAGICAQDQDCRPDQRCCAGACRDGSLCPGECHVDGDCPQGARCCSGHCTSAFRCFVPCFDDATCEDGVFCNGQSRCVANRCTTPPPVDCDDRVACTRDACDEAGRRCTHTPDDSLCPGEQMCFAGQGCQPVVRCTDVSECPREDACLEPACQGGICRYAPVPGCCNRDDECQDGKPCNGAERCLEHACQAASQPLECDDAIACTQDVCRDAAGGCEHLPRDEECTSPLVCLAGQGCAQAPACQDDEHEDNDSAQTAVPVSNDDVVTGRLCPDDGVDWFMHTAQKDTDAAIILTWAEPGDPPQLEVQGLSGFEAPPEAQGDRMKVLIREDLTQDVTFRVRVSKTVSSMYAYILLIASD
jgi:hypothetical protein